MRLLYKLHESLVYQFIASCIQMNTFVCPNILRVTNHLKHVQTIAVASIRHRLHPFGVLKRRFASEAIGCNRIINWRRCNENDWKRVQTLSLWSRWRQDSLSIERKSRYEGVRIYRTAYTAIYSQLTLSCLQ